MTTTTDANPRDLLRPSILRFGLFTVLWAVLSEGRGDGWLVPVIVIVSATASSLVLRPPGTPWSIPGLIRFIPYFLSQSARGGVDVARRAFSPRLPINPGTEEHLLRLPEEHQRVTLAAILGLFPGTLSVRLRGRLLRVHVLNRRMGTRASVRELERRLAGVFAVEVHDDEETIGPEVL